MKILLIISILFIIFGCEKTDEIASTEVFYKRDIKIEYGDWVYYGTAVLPRKNSYSIKITSSGKLDLFTWQDCHMEHTQEDAGSGGFFGTKNKIIFDYSRDFSGDTYCPVEVGGFEAVKGRHSWGFIDFESNGETLPAKLYCNGYVEETNGVSICQSRKKLIQKIVFPVAVESDFEDDKCPMPISMDSKTFEFPTVEGRCVYVFREFTEDNTGRFHRLTTLGYDKILIRRVSL